MKTKKPIKENKTWYCYTERNGWEGEEWSVFIELTQQENKLLVDIMEKAMSLEGIEDEFLICAAEPEDPEIVCKYGLNGYMPQFQIAKGFALDLKKLLKKSPENIWEQIGKLGLFEF